MLIPQEKQNGFVIFIQFLIYQLRIKNNILK